METEFNENPDQLTTLRNVVASLEGYLKKHPQAQVTLKTVNMPPDPPTREYTFVTIEVLLLVLGAFIMEKMLFKLNDRLKLLENYNTKIATAEYRGQRAYEIWEQSKKVTAELQGETT